MNAGEVDKKPDETPEGGKREIAPGTTYMYICVGAGVALGAGYGNVLGAGIGAGLGVVIGAILGSIANRNAAKTKDDGE